MTISSLTQHLPRAKKAQKCPVLPLTSWLWPQKGIKEGDVKQRWGVATDSGNLMQDEALQQGSSQGEEISASDQLISQTFFQLYARGTPTLGVLRGGKWSCAIFLNMYDPRSSNRREGDRYISDLNKMAVPQWCFLVSRHYSNLVMHRTACSLIYLCSLCPQFPPRAKNV